MSTYNFIRKTGRYILPVLLLLCLAGTTIAQSPSKEKIEALKVAFMNKNMDLSPSEAQAFWPLYNDFQNKREALKRDGSLSKTSIGTITAASDKEVSALLEADFTMRQKELDLQKDFYKKMQLVLPIKKVALYYKSEEEFKKALLNQLKDK